MEDRRRFRLFDIIYFDGQNLNGISSLLKGAVSVISEVSILGYAICASFKVNFHVYRKNFMNRTIVCSKALNDEGL